MISNTNDKDLLNIIGDFLEIELKHVKKDWFIFLMCFFVSRININGEIYPSAIVCLTSYCYIKGINATILFVCILSLLSTEFNYVYFILIIGVYSYLYSIRYEKKKHIIFIAAYAGFMLFFSKTALLLANGLYFDGLNVNIFEALFIYSSIILIYESNQLIKKIAIKIPKYSYLFNRKKKNNTLHDSASITLDKESIFLQDVLVDKIPKERNIKLESIMSESIKHQLKENLIVQNISLKFLDVQYYDKANIVFSVTVKSQKNIEQIEQAVSSEVKNVCGFKIKCIERVASANDYYVLKFKNIKKIKIRTYSAQATMDGSAISGDSYAYENRSDRYYVVLCDGIGSGKEAFNESKSAINLLTQFLNTDFSDEEIIRTLNTILMLKMGVERFVTFDLCIIDYATKEIKIYKAGAAPTYIISQGKIEVISGKSLPLGIIDEFEYSFYKKKALIGDRVIMMSDGIIDSISLDEKKSLLKYVELLKDKDPQTTSNSILSYALRGQEKIIDDMTVLTTIIG